MAKELCEGGEVAGLTPDARPAMGSSDMLVADNVRRLIHSASLLPRRSHPRRLVMLLAGLAAVAGILLLPGCVPVAVPSVEVATADPTIASAVAPPTGTLTPSRVFKGLPSGVATIPDDPAIHRFAWAYADDSDAANFELVTIGSSSCPHVPISYALADTGDLTIVVSAGPNLAETASDEIHACTVDGAVTTFVIELPEGIAIPTEITISVAEGTFDSVVIPVRDDPDK